jgi:tetratricopeptide (TPR) repeat protein
VGRQEQPLDPTTGPVQAFAHELRLLRRVAGNPGYRTLARRAGYSASALSAAASGRVLPSLAVTLAYVGACRGDVGEWERRWERIAAEVEAMAPGPEPELAAAQPAVPRQLPLDAYGFTGRVAELAALDALLAANDERSSAVLVSGTGGVGKTALAVHWAHLVADRFPDGQLYVDLRGYDPDQPLEPAEVLAAFLRSLGVAGQDIPYDLAERAARYRTLVAGRRVLVLLDNAHSTDQVRLLLPGTPACFVLVTSRDSLAGLVARHGAQRIDIGLLRPAEAAALLHTLVGDRVDAEPAATQALAERCVHLPLALRLAAEIAAVRPSSTLDTLVAELADEHHRLDLLAAGADDRTAVRTVFSWSYHHLPPDAARAFRLLGLHPGADTDLYAFAALAGVDLAAGQLLVDTLTRAHLVEQSTAGRVRMHDLLRAYAAELAEQDPAADRNAALTGLLDYYLAAGADAVDTLFPGEKHRRPRIPRPAASLPSVADPAPARAWLDAERDNLVAAVAYTARHGWPEYTDLFVAALTYYLETGGHYTDTLVVTEHLLASAREHGNRRAEGDALLRLGTLSCRWGRYTEAAGHLRATLAIRRELGDVAGVGRTLNNLGNVHLILGDFAAAADCLHESAANQRAVGDRHGEAFALLNLGVLAEHRGRPGPALDHYRQAAATFRDIGDPRAEGRTQAALVNVLGKLGRYDEAAEAYRAALAFMREIGDRSDEISLQTSMGPVLHGQGRGDEALRMLEAALSQAHETGDRMSEVEVLDQLGRVYGRSGRHAEALDHFQRVLVLARRCDEPRKEVAALNGLGETLRATGQTGDARAHHSLALRKACDLDMADEQARALDGMAYTRLVSGQPERARELWEQALARYEEIGVPEAAEVRDRLAALDAARVGAR